MEQPIEVKLPFQKATTVPPNAHKCFIIGASAPTPKGGRPALRNVTEHGIDLCMEVRSDYHGLCAMLEYNFGPPEAFYTKDRPANLITTGIIAPANHLTPTTFPTELSLRRAPDPHGKCHENFFEHEMGRGQTRADMLRFVNQNPTLLGKQDYVAAMEGAENFFRYGFLNNQLTISFGSTFTIALFLTRRGAVTPEDAVLYPCQSFIIFTDEAGAVIHAEAFRPPATRL